MIKYNEYCIEKPKPAPTNDMYNLAGGLGDLGDLNFNAEIPSTNKEEDKKNEPAKTGMDHVDDVINTEKEERDGWQKAYQKYDSKIKFWRGHPQMNSIKVLICTLHDVLWDGAKWKRVGMHELMEFNSVKKNYRKAILVVHPDRNHTAPTDQKFLANRIFGTLNEAWKVFEKTGQ